MSVQHLLPPSTTRIDRAKFVQKKHLFGPDLAKLAGALDLILSFQTKLLIGATLQSLLVLFLPLRYAMTPALLLLAVRIIDTFLVSTGRKPNSYLTGVNPKKSTAQVMGRDGNFPGAGEEKVAILLLGAKSNHPLGFFAPDFGKVGSYLKEMTEELEGADNQDNGFLGQTGWTRKDANGAIETLAISYWRSIEDVHAYAHGPLHMKAWKWWDRTLSQHGHIGFMHEVFEAPKGMFESVYINFQPTLLGATTYLKRGDKLEGGNVPDQWVGSLLDANRGRMRTSVGRRGHTSAEADKDKFGKNYYV